MSKRPAEQTAPAPDDAGSSTLGAGKRKRDHVNVACTPCRNRKVKCDGERPVCKRCAASKVQCQYATQSEDETRSVAIKREHEELQKKLGDAQGVLERLKSLPEKDSFDLWQQLRTSKDPIQSLLHAATGNPGGVSVSNHAVARTMVPARSRLEYELLVSHPDMYPLPASTVRNSGLTGDPRESQDSNRALEQTQRWRPATLPQRTASGVEVPPVYADSRLRRLDISYWTRVPVSNDFAARAISLYLEEEHAIVGLIDADLFIADLVGKRLNFCSPLLVSSMLFQACQGYSQQDPGAYSACYAFRREAIALWDADRRTDSFLTAAAAQFLCIAYTGAGEDALALVLLREGKDMAERLGLINVPPKSKLKPDEYTPDMYRALSHTAWGIYAWLVLRSMHAHEFVIRHAPNFPVPGDEEGGPQELIQPAPLYVGKTFVTLCKFWLIVNDFARLYYYETDIPLPDRVPLAFAERTYQKLLNWADLASMTLPKEGVAPFHVTIFHIFYHSTVIDLFRPFSTQDDWMRSFAYIDSTPRAVTEASLNQLKHHVLSIPSKYPKAAASILWHPACLYVANAMLTETSDPERQQYFLSCAYGYQTISSSFRLAVTILQGLLDMATTNKLISLPEARKIMDKAVENSAQWTISEQPSSRLKVDLDRAMHDPSSADIAFLAKRFEKRFVIDGDAVDEVDGVDGVDEVDGVDVSDEVDGVEE